MKCPACSNTLRAVKVGEITVDVCDPGCGGIWFDSHELKQVDEHHEAAGEDLLKIKKDPSITIDHSQKRACPRCDNVIMMRHFMSVKNDVEIDECASCRGIWLDAGELGQIRDQFNSTVDRDRAASRYFAENFGDDLEKMLKENAEKAESASRIVHMFRFLLPSYYLSGKQSWGAY